MDEHGWPAPSLPQRVCSIRGPGPGPGPAVGATLTHTGRSSRRRALSAETHSQDRQDGQDRHPADKNHLRMQPWQIDSGLGSRKAISLMLRTLSLCFGLLRYGRFGAGHRAISTSARKTHVTSLQTPARIGRVLAPTPAHTQEDLVPRGYGMAWYGSVPTPSPTSRASRFSLLFWGPHFCRNAHNVDEHQRHSRARCITPGVRAGGLWNRVVQMQVQPDVQK